MTPAEASPGALYQSEVANHFVRGFVAAGLLSALQQGAISGKPVLKHAVQGGSAIASGVAAANALQHRRYADALTAVAAGAAGIAAAEGLSRQSRTSETRDSEKRSKPMSKKKWKKAYKRIMKNGYDPEMGGAFWPYAGAPGWGGEFTPGSKGFIRNLPGSLKTRQGQHFLLGALLGAGAAYVLGNEKLRAKFMKSILKLYSGVAGGFEEFKEQLADLQAEIESECSSTE